MLESLQQALLNASTNYFNSETNELQYVQMGVDVLCAANKRCYANI